MKNHKSIIKWATDYLRSEGFVLQEKPEILFETPWSNIIQFSTTEGKIYLKQPSPRLSQEAKIIKLLADQFQASVPLVIAIKEELHCFLMKDAGQTLRSYLKIAFKPDLLYQAINRFTTIQRSTENKVESFLALDVPDWRLNKLLNLYEQIINQSDFLKAEGMTENELQLLQDLRPQIAEELEGLAQYQTPETIVQPDFNTNNILINPNTNELTLIDLGEIAVTHPFFSLHNFLYQATIHHNVKENDPIYHKLQETCVENWLELGSKKELLKGFILSKKLWPIYSVVGHYHFMHCVDLKLLKSFYPNRPNQLAKLFRQYINS